MSEAGSSERSYRSHRYDNSYPYEYAASRNIVSLLLFTSVTSCFDHVMFVLTQDWSAMRNFSRRRNQDYFADARSTSGSGWGWNERYY